MERFKFLPKNKAAELPKGPGVYAFLDKKEFLYIGKANNLKGRIKNHFRNPKSILLRQGFGGQVGFIKTNSAIEALLLEAKLIKKYKPKYNVIWKDSKNYFFVAITKEILPKVFITHQIKKSEIRSTKSETNSKFEIRNSSFRDEIAAVGPFVDGKALKTTLKYLRRIFPYYTAKKHPQKSCPWCHLNLCPGPNPNPKDYQKNIKNLIKVLKGEKQSVLKNLKKEMIKASQKQDFEKAAEIRNKISAFNNIFEHAQFVEEKTPKSSGNWEATTRKLQKLLKTKKKLKRIEAYDISNIQGKEATGSMVVFMNGEPDKNFYRKFRIRMTAKPNDVAMIKEVLSRRFKHKEWTFPDLILIDGGKGQLNAALEIRKQKIENRIIRIMALAKRNNELYIEETKKPVLLKNLSRGIFNLILQLRDEAHRFARAYHHKLRKKEMLR